MIKEKLNKIMSLKRLGFFVIALTVLMISSSYGIVVSLPNQPVCKNLIAGQTINAGDVCLTVIDENLIVTYTTTDNWELTEAHLWVGKNISDMPQTKQGNPKVGNFPYNSGDITGAKEYSFIIPLASLEPSGTDLCDKTYFAAAHAALRKPIDTGGYQTETGWASGDPIIPKGSWAMYFSFTFTCNSNPPPVHDCETAFAFGNKALWDIIDPTTGDPITNRWGWEIILDTANTTYPLTQKIYSGAAQNDTTKGTYVGDLIIYYDGNTLTINYVMNPGYVMQETHLYAGIVETTTASPGLFGHTHDLDNATSDSYQIVINGCPPYIYIVAHAVVCESN